MLAQIPAKLPDPAAVAASDREDFPVPLRKSPTRVLVVDDEPLVRWSIAETLASHGYEIAEAGDYKSAIHALDTEDRPPDIVLLDLRLPDCNDLKLLAAVRRLAPAARVILMTAFGSPEVRIGAELLGACRVIDKPFDLDGLDGLLEEALSGRRAH
jgi:DNA-binding NtrC family response regulator